MSADIETELEGVDGEAETDGIDEQVVRDLIAQNNELQDRVDELEEQVNANSTSVDAAEARIAMASLASAITGRDISRSNDMVESSKVILEEFQQLRERVGELEEFMDSYGVEKPRDENEAWKKIVDAARNKQHNPTHAIKGTNEVSLYIDNLETATGFSDRHCSTLIEDFADDKRGTRMVGYEPASAANNHSATKKQLVIDLDVWGEPE